ncbi:group 1 truncated hemoglobin [Oxalobacteraceae bacterium OM1]|nr:group 1 truncated hemoglobin [Oxalobacteraceae bacterium OM1]
MKHMNVKRALLAAAGAALLVVSQAGHAEGQGLYEGLGGKEGIQRIVSAFLQKVLADERINAGFRDVDTARLARLLGEQFCAVSGGPCRYAGKDMKTIHEDLRITDAQFNALAEDLQAAMDAQDVPPAVQNKLIARLAPMHRDIVTK